MKQKINANGSEISVINFSGQDYVSLTDIARFKNILEPKDVVKNWMRSKETILFLGLWEELNNPDFKGVEFDSFKNQAGTNAFTMSPKRWIESTNAIGMISKAGKYDSGTYAHSDIAFEFASWVSAEFKLYIIKDFQRLKAEEQKIIGWNAKRELSKLNYRIHTDAIKQNLIPNLISKEQSNLVYANEADVLNVALFGITAKEWRIQNANKEGNIRDYASMNELICLANLESINAILINDGLNQSDRLIKLNKIAIAQMNTLEGIENKKFLK